MTFFLENGVLMEDTTYENVCIYDGSEKKIQSSNAY